MTCYGDDELQDERLVLKTPHCGEARGDVAFGKNAKSNGLCVKKDEYQNVTDSAYRFLKKI